MKCIKKSKTKRQKRKEWRKKKKIKPSILQELGRGRGCTVGRERIKAHNCIIIAVDT